MRQKRTVLEGMRDAMKLRGRARHTPQWRIVEASDRFVWIMDGACAVALVDRQDEMFELRCHGPGHSCPPAVVPKHYHIVTYAGVRFTCSWWVGDLFGRRETRGI